MIISNNYNSFVRGILASFLSLILLFPTLALIALFNGPGEFLLIIVLAFFMLGALWIFISETTPRLKKDWFIHLFYYLLGFLTIFIILFIANRLGILKF